MKILFQGDSITDVGKNAGSGSLVPIGQGYPLIVSAKLGAEYPGKYTFVNKGISGSRIVDVYARIKSDCWNDPPQLFSMLIGVNDVWHEVGGKNGVDAERFYTVYKMLVTDTLKRFPDMKMILMEPFVLNASATVGLEEYFRTEVALRGEAVRKIAEETDQYFLPLQNVFNEAAKLMPNDYWLGDGVHPTPAGHQLIADEWLKLFNTIEF